VVRYDIAQTLSGETAPYGTTMTQRAQARSNIKAAPMDALSYSGLQINGSCEVSQERGTTSFALTNNTLMNVQDGWSAASNSAGALRCSAFPATVPGSPALPTGFPAAVALAATTGQASLGAGDFVYLRNAIEGYRISRLAWGTANAQPISIGFWVAAAIAGTMSVAVLSSGSARSYVTNIVINSPATWEYKTLTIPGDTAGTWNASNGTGFDIRFCFGAGTTYQGAANTWAGSLLLGTSSTTNFFATTNNNAYITGLVVLPGVEVPSAARSALIMRPLDQELMMCKRYYELVGLTMATNGLWVNNGWYKVTKRANPTITLFSGNAQSGAVTPMGSDSLNGFVQSTNSTVASGVLWAADARL